MAIGAVLPVTSDSGAPAWIGSYRVLDCLATGGMGRLFRALDTANGRMVAMKLPLEGTTAEVTGLLREGAALKRLRHPGIVRLLDDGSWSGMPWLALELLQGCTLLEEMDRIGEKGVGNPHRARAWRRRAEELPTVPGRLQPPGTAHTPSFREERPIAAGGRLREVAALVAQLAMILDHLHGHGLVHRDLKPANVFLRTIEGGGARVTLLDFGLVCRANAARPLDGGQGICVGTMLYAAPEQIIGDPVDGRADVYSLGCILYELVTGLQPFEGDSGHEVAQRHLYRKPVVPRQLVSGLTPQLDELVMEMLAKKPGDRPISAGAAGARLVAAVRGVENAA